MSYGAAGRILVFNSSNQFWTTTMPRDGALPSFVTLPSCSMMKRCPSGEMSNVRFVEPRNRPSSMSERASKSLAGLPDVKVGLTWTGTVIMLVRLPNNTRDRRVTRRATAAVVADLRAPAGDVWKRPHVDLIVEPLDHAHADLVLRPAVGGNAEVVRANVGGSLNREPRLGGRQGAARHLIGDDGGLKLHVWAMLFWDRTCTPLAAVRRRGAGDTGGIARRRLGDRLHSAATVVG